MADDGREHGWFTTTDGVKIHYLTVGASGSWVVLIHGYTGTAEANWFANGIATALAARHRVVALDCRNHGRSDKPRLGGPGKAEDVIELMDHLGIARAHIHGYSMGGILTVRLLGLMPQRMLSAGFGGSGVLEIDEEVIAGMPADLVAVDPQEETAYRGLVISAAMNNGKTRDEAEEIADRPESPDDGPTPEQVQRLRAMMGDVDLSKVDIPVLAINGEYDRPHAKTHRLWRELRDFTNVVLPGKSHLTAIVAGYMPPEYLQATVRFINANDDDHTDSR